MISIPSQDKIEKWKRAAEVYRKQRETAVEEIRKQINEFMGNKSYDAIMALLAYSRKKVYLTNDHKFMYFFCGLGVEKSPLKSTNGFCRESMIENINPTDCLLIDDITEIARAAERKDGINWENIFTDLDKIADTAEIS